MSEKRMEIMVLLVDWKKAPARNIRKAKNDMTCDRCHLIIPKGTYYEVCNELYRHLENMENKCVIVKNKQDHGRKKVT